MTDLLSEMQHVDTIVNNYCVLLKLNSPEQARVLIASELFCPLLKALATTRQPILALLTTTKITRLIIAVLITYMTCDHIHIFCLQMPYLGVVHPSCNCILIGICTLEISGVWGWIMYKINVNVGKRKLGQTLCRL